MKINAMTNQNTWSEILALIESRAMCVFQTKNFNGVFNHVYKDGNFYFHLLRTDDQYKDLKANPELKIIFFDFLCNIPSYWIDEKDGGVATSYYRYAEFFGTVEFLESREDLAKILPYFLETYQSEGGYDKLEIDTELYQSDYKALGIVRLSAKQFKTKWKLGQNRSIAKRLEIVGKLRERNLDGDGRASEEILKWLAQNKES